MLRLSNTFILTILVIILTSLAPNPTSLEVLHASDSELPVYTYEFKLNTSIDYIITVSEDLVIVLGSLGGVSVVQFINVSDPFTGPQIIFTYPLTGKLTSYAVDGFPVNYLAVGTDLGEVVVFSVSRGRLYEKLHYIQGANFIVNSTYLLRTSTSTKLITLSVNKDLPSEKYLYVFDINMKGVLRIGPLVGNLSYALEGFTPHAITPIKIVNGSGYYYNAYQVPIVYTGLMATLMINATYVENSTLVNASNAYVEIRVYNATYYFKFSYEINLDDRGFAEVLVPLGYLVDVIIYDIYGNPYKKSLNLSEVVVPKITLNFELRYRPNTRKALIGMPMFIKLFNFSEAPVRYDIVTDLFIPNYTGTQFYMFKPTNFKIMEEYTLKEMYLILIKHLNYLNLTYMYGNYTLANLLLHDYLGYHSGDVTYVGTDPNCTYVIVTLSDGRVKVYRRVSSLSPQHILEQEYIALGTPLNLNLILIDGKPYYVLYSTGGLQVISLEPTQIPILRLENLLTFNIPEARYADSLSDLSLIAIGGGNRLLLIKNLNTYLRSYGPRPIDLNKVKLPSLTINVLGPDYSGLPNAKVVLMYDNISKELITDEFGNAVLSNVFPERYYLLSIYPQVPYLSPINTSIYVPRVLEMTHKVVVNYTLYELKLFMNDEFGGGPQAPLDIYVNNTLLVSDYLNELLSIKLPYGNYSLLVKPQSNYTYFYEPINMLVIVDGDLKINLTLVRKSYNVTLNIVDAVSRGVVDSNVLVMINSLIESVRGSLTTTLKAGRQLVNILIPPELSDVYLSTSTTINVMTDSIHVIEVPRRAYTVNYTLIDSLTKDLAIGLYDVYVNNTKALTDVSTSFNVTLPYGNNLISIRPKPPYDSKYLSVDLTLYLKKDESLTIYLDRVRYSLNIRLYDQISNTPIAPLKLLINDELHIIPKGVREYTLSLPYGIYVINLMPDTGFENVYHHLPELTVNLTRNTVVDLILLRKYYNLSVTLHDITRGPLLGLVDVEVNGTVVKKGVSREFNISLPYDTYLIRVRPQLPYTSIYSDSEAVVKLFNDTSIDIIMSRKYYMLTLMIRDDRESPLIGAEIVLLDTISGDIVSRGLSGGDGRFATSLYYGSFMVIARYSGFHEYRSSIELTSSITEKVILTPLPTTTLVRYSPLIIIASLIIVSIIIILKLRSKITERLLRAEEAVF